MKQLRPGIVVLRNFDNAGFDRGKSKIIEVLWLLLDAMLVRSRIPGSVHRRLILRAFGARIGKRVLLKPGVRVKFPFSVITSSLYCDDDGSMLQTSLRERIDATVLPISSPKILKRVSGAIDAIDKAVRTSDVVHLHTLWHPMNSIAREACQRHRRRYALMPHGMLDPYCLQQKRWRKAIYLATVERRNLQGASKLIFTTTQEQQAAIERVPWLGPSEVVPLGADSPSAASREVLAERFTRLFPQASNRRCVLFLGRIHRKKGLVHALRALPTIKDQYPKILLIVAGDGDKGYVDYVKKIVRIEQLDAHVLFTGLLTGEPKWGALASSEVFLLPSSQENFAISMAEAMQMGVPVIVSDKVNSWPFVKAADAGFVIEEKNIASQLVHRLSELLADPRRSERLGEQGRNFARENFCWRRVVRDMICIYQSMLA